MCIDTTGLKTLNPAVRTSEVAYGERRWEFSWLGRGSKGVSAQLSITREMPSVGPRAKCQVSLHRWKEGITSFWINYLKAVTCRRLSTLGILDGRYCYNFAYAFSIPVTARCGDLWSLCIAVPKMEDHCYQTVVNPALVLLTLKVVIG